MYSPLRPARGGLRRVLAVASWMDFHGWNEAEFAAVLDAEACGNRDRAAYWRAQVEAKRPTWTHERRHFGRDAAAHGGRVRRSRARYKERRARRLRMRGKDTATVAYIVGVSERQARRYLAGCLYQVAKAARHERERRGRAAVRAFRQSGHERTPTPVVLPLKLSENERQRPKEPDPAPLEAWRGDVAELARQLAGRAPPGISPEVWRWAGECAVRYVRQGFAPAEVRRIVGIPSLDAE